MADIDEPKMLEYLKLVPSFNGYSRQDLKYLAGHMSTEVVWKGTVLVHQGALNNRFFVVLDGEVEVTRDGKHVSTMGPGGFFGEMSLLSDAPASADVVTGRSSTLLTLDRAAFRQALKGHEHLARDVQALVDARASAGGSGSTAKPT